MRRDNPHLNDTPDDELIQFSAACGLSVCLEKSHILSEISFPGLLDIYPGIVYENNNPVISIRRKNTFRTLLKYTLNGTVGWPLTSELNLADVFTWLKKIEFGQNYYAATPIQRSVAAYGHVISLGQFNEGECLFRIVQALEAFYTTGNGDLRNQLSEKSKLFLDGHHLEKNLVGKLYDMRSKFIHGAAAMTYSESWGDELDAETKDNSKRAKQFQDSIDFGLQLLISSIQKCVKETITTIDWGYSYSTDSD